MTSMSIAIGSSYAVGTCGTVVFTVKRVVRPAARVYTVGVRRLTPQPIRASGCGMQYRPPRSRVSKQVRETRSGEKPVQRISRPAAWVDLSVIRPAPTMFVLTNVGHSTVTFTPVPDNSAASVSDSDSTPALLTL